VTHFKKKIEENAFRLLTETQTHDKAVDQIIFTEKGILMVKPGWGLKRVCPNCNARFYDMCHHPITCPKCSSTFDPEAFVKKRRGRPPASEPKPLPLVPGLEEDLELAETLEPLDEADDVLEDTSDFGEDERVVGIETPADEE